MGNTSSHFSIGSRQRNSPHLAGFIQLRVGVAFLTVIEFQDTLFIDTRCVMVHFRVGVRHVERIGDTPNVDQPSADLEVLSYDRSISAPSTHTMLVKGAFSD